MKIELTKEERQQLNLEAKLTKNEVQGVNCVDVAIPKLNFAISSYYKGTGLEEVLKKYKDVKKLKERWRLNGI